MSRLWWKIQDTQKRARKVTHWKDKAVKEQDQDTSPDIGTSIALINMLKYLWKQWTKYMNQWGISAEKWEIFEQDWTEMLETEK